MLKCRYGLIHSILILGQRSPPPPLREKRYKSECLWLENKSALQSELSAWLTTCIFSHKEMFLTSHHTNELICPSIQDGERKEPWQMRPGNRILLLRVLPSPTHASSVPTAEAEGRVLPLLVHLTQLRWIVHGVRAACSTWTDSSCHH